MCTESGERAKVKWVGKTKTKFIIIMRIIGFLWLWLWPERRSNGWRKIDKISFMSIMCHDIADFTDDDVAIDNRDGDGHEDVEDNATETHTHWPWPLATMWEHIRISSILRDYILRLSCLRWTRIPQCFSFRPMQPTTILLLLRTCAM